MTGPYKSPLHQMTCTTPTDFWNDSCAMSELRDAIENGATGATSNPTIVLEVLEKELPAWQSRVREILVEHRSWSEEQVAWQVIEEMAVRAAALLQPIYETHNGQKGRLSLQTNPTYYRDAEAIVRQALHFASLAPNLHVKIPVTRAGIEAIEEATYRGISINGTVSFTVPQAIAVAEAVERGLNRRTAEGHDISTMRPTATLMIGRLDDWMQVLVETRRHHRST